MVTMTSSQFCFIPIPAELHKLPRRLLHREELYEALLAVSGHLCAYLRGIC